MPNYDFLCEKCGAEFEAFRHINEDGDLVCPKCGGKARKIPSLVGFSIHNTHANSRASDARKEDAEYERKMKEKFGIVGIDRLRKSTMKEVWNDAIAQEGLIKEQFAFQQEDKAKKTAAKMKEWKREALKRTATRGREMKERKVKEAFEKRKVSISSGKK